MVNYRPSTAEAMTFALGACRSLDDFCTVEQRICLFTPGCCVSVPSSVSRNGRMQKNRRLTQPRSYSSTSTCWYFDLSSRIQIRFPTTRVWAQSKMQELRDHRRGKLGSPWWRPSFPSVQLHEPLELFMALNWSQMCMSAF